MDVLTSAPTIGVVVGDPNGAVSGARSAILRDSSGARLWICAGGTVWIALVRADSNHGGIFGTGEDGIATFDGVTPVAGFSLAGSTYFAQREGQFLDGTVSDGVIVKPDGYAHRFNGILTNNGHWNSDGGSAPVPGGGQGLPGSVPWVGVRPLPNGAIGGVGTAGGGATPALQAQSPRGFAAGSAIGGAGGPSTTAGAPGGVGQGGGGGGGASTAGGPGGVVTINGPARGDWRVLDRAVAARWPGDVISGPGAFTVGTGGGAGGGGGSSRSAGGGGSSGAWLVVIARAFAGVGTISAIGGDGAAGQTDGTFGAGGGGGAAGGVVVLVYSQGTAPTADVSGGAGGSGGAGASIAGRAGGAGGSGLVHVIPLF